MSWLSGIAGKAEALLDRMDQAAATSIQSTGIATPKSQSRVDEQRPVHQTSLTYEPTASAPTDKPLSVSSKSSSSSLSLHGAGTPPKSYSPVSRPETTPQTTPTPSSYNAYSKSRRSVPSDESLFQFLNTPTRQAAKKTHTPKKLSRASFQPSSTQPAVDSHLKEGADTPGLPVSGVEEGVEEGGGQDGGREGARSSLSEGAVDREEEGVGREGEGLSGDLRPREDTDDGGRGPPHDVPTQSSAATGNSELAAGHVTPDMPLQEGVESRDTVEPGGQAAESGRQSAGMGERDTAHAVVVQRQPRLEGTGEKQGPTGTSQPPEHQVVNLQQKLSGVELENKLLKREVSSLNDELATVLERVREAEEGVALQRTAMESLREQAATSERVIRQLRSHDEDMQSTLEARDSQIQVLRRQLQEVEQGEAVLQEKLAGKGREKERLLQDASLSHEASSHALEVVKTQLQQTEEQLSQEREAGIRTKMEFAERESALQSEHQQLSDTVAAQLRQLGILQSKVADSQRAVQAANRELARVNREHDNYKKRATGILQAKEKLIAGLQAGGGDGGSAPAHEANLEQLQLEKEAVEVDLETARLQGAELREELQEAEEQHSQELEQLTNQVRELESSLVSEKALQQSATENLRRVTAESEAAREAWESERSSFIALVQGREAEIADLRTKVPTSPLSPHSHTEMESRLHELTENLIQKQTTLEALGSEKTALKLQLERTETQLLNARRVHPPPHTAVNGLDSRSPTENTAAHIRPMTSVLPTPDPIHSDGHLRNVRRAMNSFDTFSVRLAVLLRRYPYARLFLFFYVALLHVWVLVVLLTYSPEVHDLADLQAAEPADTRL